MSLYSHCVKHGREYLLKQWDAEKNTPLTPKSVAATSTARVWWKCENGHSWQTQLSSRVRGSSGCPVCLREKIDARMEKRRTAQVEKKENRRKKLKFYPFISQNHLFNLYNRKLILILVTVFLLAFCPVQAATADISRVTVELTGTEPLLPDTLNLATLNNDATLNALTVSTGAFTPTFDPAIPEYSFTVSYATATLDVSAFLSDQNASLTVGGSPAASGIPVTVALSVGQNTIDIAVTAEDGTTKATYTVAVKRDAPATDAALRSLTISAGTLDPAFAAATTSYALSVDNAIARASVTAEANDQNASLTVGGSPAVSGIPIMVDLSVGQNDIPIEVTAQDGQTTQTYHVRITRDAASSEEDGDDSGTGGAAPPNIATPPAYTATAPDGTQVAVSVTGSTAAVTLPGNIMSSLNGSTPAEINIPGIPGVNGASISLPASVLSSPSGGPLTINVPGNATPSLGAPTAATPGVSVTLPANTLTGNTQDLQTVTVNIGATAGDTLTANAPINDVTVLAGVHLSFSIPGEAFAHTNPNAAIHLQAQLANGAALPAWMSFNPLTGTFEGTPPAGAFLFEYEDGETGERTPVATSNAIFIRVTARDDQGYEAVQNFTIIVGCHTTHNSQYYVVFNPVYVKGISESDWYYTAVSYAGPRGLLSDGQINAYDPDEKMTRAEYAVLLMRTFGFLLDDTAAGFSDTEGQEYSSYIAMAKKLGIINGTGGNLFAPDREVTRQEMFTMMVNALTLTGLMPELDSQNVPVFSDMSAAAPWAKDAITALTQAGAVNGDGINLRPEDAATNAEAMQMLYNLFWRHSSNHFTMLYESAAMRLEWAEAHGISALRGWHQRCGHPYVHHQGMLNG